LPVLSFVWWAQTGQQIEGDLGMMNTSKRKAGRPWQRLRQSILQREPLCRLCMKRDRVALAVEIDHETPLANGGTDDPTNLRPLCRECHLDATRRQFGRRAKPRIGFDGWPIE
jgi:5-methylcytosine-specific restriction endonuclease McrA